MHIKIRFKKCTPDWFELLKGILEVGCYYQRCFRGCRVFNWPLLRSGTSSMTKARAGHCWWNFCHLPFTRICQPRKIRVILHHVREYTASGQWTSCFVIGGNQVCAVLMGWKRGEGGGGGRGWGGRVHSKASNCWQWDQGREVHWTVEWDHHMSAFEENRTWGGYISAAGLGPTLNILVQIWFDIGNVHIFFLKSCFQLLGEMRENCNL